MKLVIIVNLLLSLAGVLAKNENGQHFNFNNPLDISKFLHDIENGLDAFKRRLRLIFPGTRWCGDGDIANNYRDLGIFKKVDSCCREHDLCSKSISGGETKYGLKNEGLFTKSDCDCDQKFHNCLKKTNTLLGTKIGLTYFTILGPQCFKKDCEHVGCDTKKFGRCMKYKVTSCSEQQYQWFDSAFF